MLGAGYVGTASSAAWERGVSHVTGLGRRCKCLVGIVDALQLHQGHQGVVILRALVDCVPVSRLLSSVSSGVQSSSQERGVGRVWGGVCVVFGRTAVGDDAHGM